MVAELNLLERVFMVLADSPRPEEVMALQTTEAENERLEYLQQRRNEGTLSVQELIEIEKYLDAERFVRLAKAKAFAKLRNQAA